jgi:hypothetical protein
MTDTLRSVRPGRDDGERLGRDTAGTGTAGAIQPPHPRRGTARSHGGGRRDPHHLRHEAAAPPGAPR